MATGLSDHGSLHSSCASEAMDAKASDPTGEPASKADVAGIAR